MRLYLNQLAGHLQRELKPVYWIAGDEPLLVEEACARVREQARNSGFSERERATVEAGFDWSAWLEGSQSLSLFAEKRLLELRIPRGKVDDAGKKSLAAFCEHPADDMMLMVISPKLESSVQRSKWFKAIEDAGALVTVFPLDAQALPAWIGRRMQERGLKPGSGVTETMAWHFEGNLLAAAQEIDKLALLHQGPVSADQVKEVLNDQARFDVFKLVDICLAGDARDAIRVLASLGAEGVAPTLVLWALARELRTLAQLSQAIAAGRAPGAAMAQAGIWDKRQPLVGKALKRQPVGAWYDQLQMAARIDRIIKGRAPGQPWESLQDLVLAFAGKPVQAGWAVGTGT